MIVKIYGYDEYLITDKNLDTFIGRFRADNEAVRGLIKECDDGGLLIELLNVTLTAAGLKFIENYWEADPGRTVILDSYMADKLYEIIDDIDTISDIAGGNDSLYRKLVENRIKDRLAFCSVVGNKVQFFTSESD